LGPIFAFPTNFQQLAQFPAAAQAVFPPLARTGVRHLKRLAFPPVFHSIPPFVIFDDFSLWKMQNASKSRTVESKSGARATM
jgi:hypothetical protein